MDDTIHTKDGVQQVDFLNPERGGEADAKFSAGEQKALWDNALAGGQEKHGDTRRMTSLTGRELPA